jgi:hypothetical protein
MHMNPCIDELFELYTTALILKELGEHADPTLKH